MDLLTLFLYSFWVGFSGAMMPGPLLAVGIAETPRHGWKTGTILSTGHAVAEIGVVLLLSLGVAFLTDSPAVARVIAIVGGLALLLMGGSMAYDTLRKNISYQSTSSTQLSAIRLSGKGITTTLVNPYWFIWWATIGLAMLVDSREHGIIGPIVFYFGHILSDFVWYTFVSVLLWKGRKLVAGRGLTILMLACSAFLLYLGSKFILDGLSGGM